MEEVSQAQRDQSLVVEYYILKSNRENDTSQKSKNYPCLHARNTRDGKTGYKESMPFTERK